MSETATVAALRVAVIIGSTREGRVGDRIGHWFLDRAKNHPAVEPDLVDLMEYEFPARYPRRQTEAMSHFAARVGSAEAFAVVTPEYHHSFPASLKQAIDYGYDEWQAKPVGFVCYGSGSSGLNAASQLRSVFGSLHMATVPEGVAVDLLGGELTDLLAGPVPARQAEVLLDRLVWWGLALRAARLRQPYVS